MIFKSLDFLYIFDVTIEITTKKGIITLQVVITIITTKKIIYIIGGNHYEDCSSLCKW